MSNMDASDGQGRGENYSRLGPSSQGGQAEILSWLVNYY